MSLCEMYNVLWKTTVLPKHKSVDVLACLLDQRLIEEDALCCQSENGGNERMRFLRTGLSIHDVHFGTSRSRVWVRGLEGQCSGHTNQKEDLRANIILSSYKVRNIWLICFISERDCVYGCWERCMKQSIGASLLGTKVKNFTVLHESRSSSFSHPLL